MVDHDKKVLWASFNNRGSSHDSSVFRDTKLYETLKAKSDDLFLEKFLSWEIQHMPLSPLLSQHMILLVSAP